MGTQEPLQRPRTHERPGRRTPPRTQAGAHRCPCSPTGLEAPWKRAAYQRHDSTATSAGSTRRIGSRTTRPSTRTNPALIARRARTISPTTGATTSSNRNAPTAGGAAGTTRRSPLAAGEPSTRPVGGTGSFAPRPGERSGASPLPPAPPTARTSATANSNPNSIARRTNVPRRTPTPTAAPSNRAANASPNLIVNRGSSLVGTTPSHHTGQTYRGRHGNTHHTRTEGIPYCVGLRRAGEGVGGGSGRPPV